ncbi:uncharacterized protein B0I36DRAFT_359485 [Microdochium trichocladiopsis]|uniref:DUF7137 domain-containing protein n=1 Tax=Microdochium trichocladiopsis TaxID=1682393 RepID=A0A9P8YGT3_9PEZI|nr:uncharacterized protein B0I36DRAFT_359485 [Microdochium trichocladiopsis]KAH7037845.1 hypothetical protein B0I36DRAFT_359485 [Microdochium trichocladiopsis]
MRSQLVAVALALAPLASASAWANILPDMDAIVVRRQDDSTKTTATNGPQQTNPPAGQSTTAKPSGATTKGPITTDLNTGGDEPTGSSGTVKGSGSQTKSATSTKATMFNPQDPAGGVVMVTPAASLGMPLIMIEETSAATWVWNYTSVQGTPTAVDVLVSCSNLQTITLTRNMTYKSPQTFTWDHAEYAQTAVSNQLLTDKYTLVIYDSNSAPTDVAEAGYLAPFNQFVFGLYARKPYQDLADGWQCVTCNGALGSLERSAVGFAMSMSIITILSFTWFVGGFGALL